MKKTKHPKTLAAVTLLLGTVNLLHAQTYCNPLPMQIGQGGYAAGDVTVIEEGDFNLPLDTEGK